MKLKFTCGFCGESFRVEDIHFKGRAGMHCPNCGFGFPEDLYKKLSDAVAAIGEVRDSLVKENDNDPIISTRERHYWEFSFDA